MEPEQIKWLKEHLIFPAVVALGTAVVTFGLSAWYFSHQQKAADKAAESRHAEQMKAAESRHDDEMKAAESRHAEQIRKKDEEIAALDRQTAQSALDEAADRAQRAREYQSGNERDAADRAAASAAAAAAERQQRERDWEDARSRLIVATRALYAAEQRRASPECEQKRETTTTYLGGQPWGSQSMMYADCSAAENAAQRDVDTALAEFEGRQSRAATLAPESLKSSVLELSALFASTNPGCAYFEPANMTPHQPQTPVRRCPRPSEEELRRAIAKLDGGHFW